LPTARCAQGGAVLAVYDLPAAGASWATADISSCSFARNFASGGGGALVLSGMNISLADTVCSSNAANVGASGGCLNVLQPGSLALSGTNVFANNSAGSGGALSVSCGVECAASSAACGASYTISGTTLSDNTASDQGARVNRAKRKWRYMRVHVTSGAGAAARRISVALDVRTCCPCHVAARPPPTLAGGALFVSGGGLLLMDSVVASNTASGVGAQGGGVFMREFDTLSLPSPSLVLSNVSMVGNTVKLQPVMLNAGSVYRSFAGAGNGGGIFLTVAQQTAQVQLLAGSSVDANKATNGAGLFLFGNVTLMVRDSLLARNVASGFGGGLALQSISSLAATALLESAAFTGNSAQDGGAIALNSGSTLAAAESTFTANTATNGAVLYLQVANQAAGAVSPAVALSDVRATGNIAAVAGGMYFTDAAALTALSSLPVCTGACIIGNTAPHGADTLVTMPVKLNTTATSIIAKSGAVLPKFSLSLYDGLGQLVLEAPGLVSVAANATGFSGVTTVEYTMGAALFDRLTISDFAGSVYNLTVTLNAPDVTVLDGAVISLLTTVGPCGATEVFNTATKTCTCGAGTFLDAASQTCLPCQRGSYSPTSSASACALCSPGAYSNDDFTSCVPCTAGSVLR
jgi:hypothetical protein